MTLYQAVGSHKSTPGRGPLDFNCNHNSRQGYSQRFAPQDSPIVNPKILIPAGWLIFSGTAAETNDPYTWQDAYALEYPVGATKYPFTFAGQRVPTIPPGAAVLESDPIAGLTIPPGAKYVLRDWGQSTTLRPPAATVTFVGGHLVSGAISDPGQGLNTTVPVHLSTSAPPLTAAIPAGAGAGTGAAIGCVVAAGVLASLTLTPGSGYTDGTYPVIFDNGANMARSTVRSTGDGAAHGTNLPDLTLSTTIPGQDQLGEMAPMLIVGEAQTPRAPAIGLIMDSILDGTSDQLDFPSGHIGAFEKSMTNRHGWVAIGCDGERLADYIARHSQQSMLLPSITHLVCGLIRNDATAPGVTLAGLQALARQVWAPYLAAGIAVYQVTPLPTTLSTDGWATLGNQTIQLPAQNVVRLQFIDWLRSGAAGVVCVDMCAVIESASAGKFMAGLGKSALPRITITGGVVVSALIQAGVNYPPNAAIPCEIFYPEGCPGSGLALTAHTDAGGNVTATTVDRGGSGHVVANPPWVGLPGAYTIDGVHPSTYAHFKMGQAGLFSPSRFTIPAPTPPAPPFPRPIGLRQ